jgi:ParB family transcriptional regulator, chromosome partitioning protein
MARKRPDVSALFVVATDVASEIHHQDQVVEEKSERDRSQRTTLLLNRIQLRSQDTRPLDEAHVRDLVESISILGLIEPLVVDRNGKLLAGGHRLAAIKLLKESSPKVYNQYFPGNQIPVRMMPCDADIDQEMALQIELAENEKRVNYSRDQIKQLAERLRALDYRSTRGRPKQGEKALGPALAVAIGVSARYVRKVLSEELETDDTILEENRNSVPIFNRTKSLRKLERSLLAFSSLPKPEKFTRQDESLDRAVANLLKQIETSLRKRKANMGDGES